MHPLQLCFLWHQHQPDYRTRSGFFLPWVRMHAVKDYLDLPLILSEYPVRHTINLVPAMLMQIEEYGRGRKDPVQRMCEGPPERLTSMHRAELMSWARTVQRETMTESLPRLRELIDLPHQGDLLSDQEVLDLQVSLLLAWTGPISRRQRPAIQDLILQGRDFTVEQRDALMAHHDDIMKQIIPTLLQMEREGKIEISVTPYHHPILPLLCSTDAALESRPEDDVPSPPFSNMDDAHWHVNAAVAFWNDHSQSLPRGMWPAEGSISDAALDIMVQHGIRWAATDEDVLKHTLGDAWTDTSAFAPYTITTPNGTIAVLFRDHSLSDAIGFEYSSWDPNDAADDFVHRLEERRERILSKHGVSALERMVVPVILDAENCWEFYRNNGEQFIRALSERLSDDQRFRTLTCSEAALLAEQNDHTLHHVVAGSWIHGTFQIWIGTAVKNLAWSLLRDARQAISAAGDREDLLEIVRRLEASDWFWWYEDRHLAPHKDHFDMMFREQLMEIFETVGVAPAVDLTQPLAHAVRSDHDMMKSYPISFGSAAMHDSDAITDVLTIETSGNWQRFSLHFRRNMHDPEEVFMTVSDRHGDARRVGIVNSQVIFSSDHHDEGFDRQHDRIVSIYLHAAEVWRVDVEEQRSTGRSWLCGIDVHPPT